MKSLTSCLARIPIARRPALALLLWSAPAAWAQVVTTTADSGNGSLRAVIAAAPSGATVTFDSSLAGKSIVLSTGEIPLTKDITLDASPLPGGIQVMCASTNNHRILTVAAGVTARLERLRLSKGANGSSDSSFRGGAMYNQGTLTLTGCTLDENSAGWGGAIFNLGKLSLNQCTLVGNKTLSATGTGGGALFNQAGTMTVNQSTLTGNQSYSNEGGMGGAIYNNGGNLAINQSTVTENLASSLGGGIHSEGGTFLVFNSIVASNEADSNPDIDGTYTLKGTNFIGGNPLLLPLGNHGGPTQTMPPRPESPAVDAGSDKTDVLIPPFPDFIPTLFLFPNDQRGVPRLSGQHVDIGAVELQAIRPVVTNTDDSGPGSLRQAIADGEPMGATITFGASLSGQAIQLSSPLQLTKPCIIDASALPGGIQLVGSQRVLHVTAGTTARLHALTIRKGFDPSQGGGILNEGRLTLDRCTVTGNGGDVGFNGSLTAAGGGIHNSGQLTLNQCTVAHNAAASGGGIRNQPGATLEVNQSTITANDSTVGTGGISCQGTTTLFNTIVAGNTTTKIFVHPNIASPALTTNGQNLLSGDPGLATLGNHGGPTPTCPPLPGSPALDAAPASVTDAFALDQRGGWRRIGPGIDLGAVEYQDPDLILTSAYWRLGEQDPGALGNPRPTTTVNALGSPLRLVPGASYTNTTITAVAQGIGRSLGMRFLPGQYAVNEPFPHTDNFGLELWVRPDATDGTRCVAYNGATDGNGWGLYLLNGTYQVLLGNRLLFGEAPAVVGEWTHLALVRNSGTNTFYVNGVATASNLTEPIPPSTGFGLAAPPQDPTVEFFAGTLDEVRVFKFSPGAFEPADLLLFRNPQSPTTLTLASPGVLENEPAGTFVGRLSGTDPNPGQSSTLSFHLVPGSGDADNASFTIIGNELRTAGSLDFDTSNTRTVRIRATDSDGLVLEKAFTINLGNLDEPPVAGLDTLERPDTSPVLRIPRSRLLVNDSDPESRPLLILSVSNPLPVGATVSIDDEFITYAAPTATAGHGSFNYTISDGVENTTGTVLILESESYPAAIRQVGSSLEIQFTGVPGRRYRVQYTSSLTPPIVWEDHNPAAEFVVPETGILTFPIVAPTEASRFYRTVLRQ